MGFCSKCGAEYQEGALFCAKCGTKLSANDNKTSDSLTDKESENATSSRESDTIIKKSKSPIILLIAVPVVLLFLVVAVGVTSYFTLFSQSARDRREVNKQLKLAERYLDELDYEQAIAAYKAVLEIDPNNAEALAALNDVYEKWAESDPASADKIYEEALAYYASLNERAGTDVAATYIAGMEQKKSNSNGAAGNMPAITEHNLTVTVVGANETGAISGAEITISGTDISTSAESDGSGKADFAGLSDGSVKISVSASGYNSRELEVNISGADLNKTVALVPEISGDDAMVLLTWNGDHDLDLCAFNSSIKEYVSIGHPMDSEGNVFLYADHGADLQYEVIYIHNASAEMVRTFYVADAGKARNGDSSSMESDGVSVYVYNNTGLTYSSTADTSQSAPLWCPCYYYAGVVYDQGDYIYDTTDEQYAWISFDEKDAIAEDASQADGWKRAYINLLYQYGSEGEFADDGIGTSASIFYLDDDDIPEISIVTGGAGPNTWGAIYSYTDGEPVQLCTANASVILGEGMLFEYEPYDSMGTGDYRILKWDGDSVQELWYGSEYVDEEASVDGEDLLREYTSNGKTVSQEEYYADIAKYYDFNRCVNTGTDMTFGEAVAYLSNSLWGESGGAEWKQAYLNVVNEFVDENGYDSSLCWGILFIDDDNIPELVWDTGTTACGEMVYTYSGGEAVEIYYAYSPISFILGKGLISGSTGHGICYVNVVKLSNGNATTVWEGVEDAYESYMGNSDALPIYYSNSVEVTEEEYNKAYADVFNGEKAVWLENPSFYYLNSVNDEYHSRCIPGMTTEEVIEYLTTSPTR